jgi:hypothetical protein
MIFPPDPEIREYSAYYIRAVKIFRETFKIENGREPSEFELQDFSKMGIIPFGILKQQNGSSHFQSPQVPAQKQAQPPEKKQKTESVMDIVNAHKELAVEGDRVVVKKKIESKEEYFRVRDEFKERGWEYIAPKHVGGDKWEPGYFELKEGAKA